MSNTVTRRWILDHVRWIYGFNLQNYQLYILERLLSGGVYSVLLPTYGGKSMMIEMTVVLGLIRDPNARYIIIKINTSAAKEACAEVYRKLEIASERYPKVKPQVKIIGGYPASKDGFDVAGVDRDAGRNTNQSVHCYGLGERSLQGKRGKTLMDDVETMEEAKSEVRSSNLRGRVSAVTRTLEVSTDMLWSIFGTPTHDESVYYSVVDDLDNLSRQGIVNHEQIRLPMYAEEGDVLGRKPGEILWTEIENRAKIHKAMMDESEYAAAYDLKSKASVRWDREDFDRLMADESLPWIENETHFYSLLRDHLIRDPKQGGEVVWRATVDEVLAQLKFAIGWDPATTGVFATCAAAFLGPRFWLFRTYRGTANALEQASLVAQYWTRFPSSTVVVEANAQQRSFIDVFEQVCPQAITYAHKTFRNKTAPQIGLPTMLRAMRRGQCRVPWGDAERSEEEFAPLIYELKRNGPTSHPHLLPAIWFAWHYCRSEEIDDNVAMVSGHIEREEQEKRQEEAESVRIVRLPTGARQLTAREATIRRSSSKAWGRRWN